MSSCSQGYRVFNTWMGDPSKLVILREVISTMRKEKLMENTSKVGEYMLGKLTDAQVST